MDKLLDIFNELTRTFKSDESFERFYESYLVDKTPVVWERELTKKLFQIHTYLKERFIKNLDDNTVSLWLDRVAKWESDVSIIEYHLKNTIEEYEGHINVPERIYGEDIIDIDIQKTGKTYEELKPAYRRKTQQRVEILRSILIYSNASMKAVSFARNEMENTFAAIKAGGSRSRSAGANGGISETNLKKDRKAAKSFETSKSPRETQPLSIPAFDMILSYRNNLTSLCNYWKREGVIESKITAADFRKVFEGKVSKSKIYWTKDLKDLKTFVDLLIENELVAECKKWKTSAVYFTRKKLGPFSSRSIGTSVSKGNTIPKYIQSSINILKTGKEF